MNVIRLHKMWRGNVIVLALCLFAVLLALWLVKKSNYDCPVFMYAWAYNVQPNQVFKTPKPHDCEWGAAPLGDKFCHYEKAIDVSTSPPDHKPGVWIGWSKVED